MSPRKTKTAIVVILLVFILAFIFGNFLPVAQSQEKSLGVMKTIKPMLEVFVCKGAVTDFTEFFVLGIVLLRLCALRQKTLLQM